MSILRARAARVTGLTLLLASVLVYQSYDRRPVLDRWSYPHAAVILGVAGWWLAALAGAWRARRRHPISGAGAPSATTLLLDGALLAWGLATLLAALDAPIHGGRLLALNLLGSAIPAPALLEWLVLVALSLAAGLALRPGLRPPLVNPALSLAAVWSLLLLGEGIARMRAVLDPELAGFPTHAVDLWVRRYARFNAQGFRDRDHAIAPAPGVRRLGVIGDSFAFGAGIIRIEDRFGERLARELSQATGAEWEAINASLPDRHTLEEITMVEAILPYRPDVVVLVYVFNDMDYLRPAPAAGGLAGPPGSMWQRVHPVRLLFQNSYLFQEIYVRVRPRLPSSRAAYQPYADTVAVRTHLGDLRRLVQRAGAHGATVGIVPFDNTVSAEPANRSRHDAFVLRAGAAGLPVWPIAHAFQGLPLSQVTVNPRDGHPNARAHGLAAAAVLPQLLQATSWEKR